MDEEGWCESDDDDGESVLETLELLYIFDMLLALYGSALFRYD